MASREEALAALGRGERIRHHGKYFDTDFFFDDRGEMLASVDNGRPEAAACFPAEDEYEILPPESEKPKAPRIAHTIEELNTLMADERVKNVKPNYPNWICGAEAPICRYNNAWLSHEYREMSNCILAGGTVEVVE